MTALRASDYKKTLMGRSRSRRVEMRGFLAILLAAGGIVLAAVAAAPTRPGGVTRQAPPASVQDRLKKVADANLKANHFLFADGTDGWTASPGLYDYSFAADTGITMLNYPSYFTPAQILNIAEKFIAAKNAAGEFPICLHRGRRGLLLRVGSSSRVGRRRYRRRQYPYSDRCG